MNKNTLQDWLQGQFDELDAEFDKLVGKAKEKEDEIEIKADYEKRKEALKSKINDIKEGTTDNRETLKVLIQSGLDEIKNKYEEFKIKHL